MDTPERDIILKAITEEEKQLVKFEHERNQALSRINTLKQKLASLNVAETSQSQESPVLYSRSNITPITSTEKVKLFHSLFHWQGRYLSQTLDKSFRKKGLLTSLF